MSVVQTVCSRCGHPTWIASQDADPSQSWVCANCCLDLRYEDREPQPADGPEYHADHQAWVERQRTKDSYGT